MEKYEKLEKTPLKNPAKSSLYSVYSAKLTNKDMTTLSKPLIKEKKILPPIILTNSLKCTFCQSSVQKILFKAHFDSHPTKILDFLYLGSFSNALNSKVQIL